MPAQEPEMRPLSDTLDRLARLNRQVSHETTAENLIDFSVSGANPGNLSAKLFVPAEPVPSAALVVVLHGCTQTAAGYDACAGWSPLGEEFGFYVLLPQQNRTNNANLCFSWFSKRDIARDEGEAMSIRQMIAEVTAKHPIDSKRVFITGLSAGGAMANVMMATYPEIFAGGSIIAGLPYGVASSVPEAFDRMRGHGLSDKNRLRTDLLDAPGKAARWPPVSLWHGAADRTVACANSEAIVEQWMAVHAVEELPDKVETNGRITMKTWLDRSGQPAIILRIISGMDHGTPVDALLDREQGGPFMIDVGVSSTAEIAHEWGITPTFERGDRPSRLPKSDAPKPTGTAIKDTIEAALRSAGLMK
jgi:poly(hydroxyalkanoate) depolymerase family esterase